MVNYQADDVMPNDGTYFAPREPEAQVVERKKEKAHTLEALAVIKAVIEHFDERITFRNTLDAINVDLAKDPLMHQKICEVNGLLKLALIEEKRLLEELLDIHARNR